MWVFASASTELTPFVTLAIAPPSGVKTKDPPATLEVASTSVSYPSASPSVSNS